MPVPVEAEVRAALEPYNKRVRLVLDKAFKAYLAKRGGGNVYKRTDSADIFDSVVQVAMAEFNGKPGIEVFPNGATARFLFARKVLARFKKASRKGRGQNIKTGANDKLLKASLPFPDAPQAMKVEICWKVNELGTGYTDVKVTARDGNRVLWTYEMPGGAQEIIEFPTKPAVIPPKRRTVAKLKNPAKTKKNTGGGEAS